MASLPTISQTIDYTDLAIGLCANDNSLGALFGKRITAPSSPITQTIVNDALRWALAGGAVSAIQLRQMANYVTWLTTPYFLTAKNTISGGSGGGTVVPIGGHRYEWYSFVGTVGSGQDDSNTYFNLIFEGAVQLNSFTINSGGLQTDPPHFTFDTDSGTIDWSPNKFFDWDVIAAQFYRKIS